MTTAPTRRERLRTELTDQIVEIGRRQLESGGIANVNWRGIAQEIGMNPASLYTYVDGINDLYTRILGHSFAGLAGTVRAAADRHDTDARTQLLECARAYRRWALDQPNQFNLIFTNQIPGYEAPADGAAFDAALAVDAPFVDAMLRLVDVASIEDLPGETAARAYGFRSMMHGFTTLEVNHHSPYVNDADDLMIRALAQVIDDLVDAQRK